MKKFGRYIKKAQTGVEVNKENASNNNQNKVNWGQIGTALTPLAFQFANQQAQKANVYNSNDPYYNQIAQSNYATQIQNQQKADMQKGQMYSNVASTALNLAVPGLGLAIPATDAAINAISTPEQKYGINYYDKNWEATVSNFTPSRMLNNAFTFSEDETDLEKGADLATLGMYSALFKSKQRNEQNKNRIKELETTQQALENRNKYLTQGIYAKKGVNFGKYKINQIRNVPKHSDNKVYDSIENKEYPAMEKGAGGVIIPFGKGNEKKKVLIENGEYIVKDEDDEIIAVLPKKIGQKVLKGDITLEQAFDEVPDVNEAETAKVMQDGGVDEAATQEQNATPEEQNAEQSFMPINESNSEPYLTVKKLIYSGNPVLNAILNKTEQRKLVAKKGLVNDNGYLNSSENKNNPINIIKSSIITTEGMAFPIYANGKLLNPNTGLYKFNSKYVIETPAFKYGGKCVFGKYTKKAQKGIDWSDPEIAKDNATSKWYDPDIAKDNSASKWYDPEIAKDNSTANWYDPDIEKDNEISKWYDPEIEKYNKRLLTNNKINKKINSVVETVKKNPFNFSRVTNANHANDFKAIDPNTAFSYGLGLYQLWKAHNAKPSERGAYTMSPEIKRVLGQRKYYEKYGDQKGYKDALRNIEAERMRAMQSLKNTNSSSGSYLNSFTGLTTNLANAQNEARNKFITEQQRLGRENTGNWINLVYQPQLQGEFNDSVSRYKDHQAFLDNREKAIMGSLKYMNDILQNRKTNAISQYNEYFKQMDAYNKNVLEYKLLYGTDEEKKEAQYLLENPHLLYTRATPKYFGFYQPHTQPFKKL